MELQYLSPYNLTISNHIKFLQGSSEHQRCLGVSHQGIKGIKWNCLVVSPTIFREEIFKKQTYA